MNIKTIIKVGLLFFFLSLNPFRNIAFSQEKLLLVLDIQEFDFKSVETDSAVNEMIKNVNALIPFFNADNVVYVKAAEKLMSITSSGITVDTLPALDFVSALNVVSNHIFIKTEGDAFTAPELNRFLEERKVKDIVLVGLMAEKCILHTALGGKEKAYSITVVPEAIVGNTLKKKEKALKKMSNAGIISLPLKEIIYKP